ncbi:helix-turn-helix transcriptional regulator [Gracilibacillus sp. S3-1-1]|uniref:Helix-turn-helix transcriptional regulator n=1 Tax=Gracilibacillus pellucidus TaxID=3095368 RepID=A0ACC6M3B7_9BACI|nr:helix-turn-helix transcriptional regulator [Gracilibacillus sp. S3-1-1]MDX8045448.1 helix-turn-helix transcriptional regulator [Gracilibacillus sp. S3-1-1]
MKQNMSNEQRKEQFLIDNYVKWNEEGQYFRKKRNQLGLTLNRAAELLGTSSTRIRKFEIGEPISMANHLKKTYSLLIDHIELHAAILDLRENHKVGGH